MGTVREKFETKFGSPKQPENEAQMDNFNNKIGRLLGQNAKEQGWSDDRMAQEIKKVLDENRLMNSPVGGKPSILDYYKSY